MFNPKNTVTEIVLNAIKEHGPVSSQQIAELTGKSTNTVDFYLRVLAKCRPKCIYIAGYNRKPSTANGKRMWAYGNQPDAVRPKYQHETQEEREAREDAAARRAALRANRIYRDEMIFRTAGRHP